MLAKDQGKLYVVVAETEETITVAWHQTTYYKTHRVERYMKRESMKPGFGEDFEQVDELIGAEDYT